MRHTITRMMLGFLLAAALACTAFLVASSGTSATTPVDESTGTTTPTPGEDDNGSPPAPGEEPTPEASAWESAGCQEANPTGEVTWLANTPNLAGNFNGPPDPTLILEDASPQESVIEMNFRRCLDPNLVVQHTVNAADSSVPGFGQWKDMTTAEMRYASVKAGNDREYWGQLILSLQDVENRLEPTFAVRDDPTVDTFYQVDGVHGIPDIVRGQIDSRVFPTLQFVDEATGYIWLEYKRDCGFQPIWPHDRPVPPKFPPEEPPTTTTIPTPTTTTMPAPTTTTMPTPTTTTTPEPEKCFDDAGNKVFDGAFCGTPDSGPEQQNPQDNNPEDVAPTENAPIVPPPPPPEDPPTPEEEEAVGGNNPPPPELEDDPPAPASDDACPEPDYQAPGTTCAGSSPEQPVGDGDSSVVDPCPSTPIVEPAGFACPPPPPPS